MRSIVSAILFALALAWSCRVATAVAAGGGGCTTTLAAGDDVQQAIDGLPAGPAPRTVCLGAGEFRLARHLTIDRDGVRLRGTGPSTILRLAEGVQSAIVVVGDPAHEVPSHPVSEVAIERLRIVGGGRSGPEFDVEAPYLSNSAVVIRAGRHVVLGDLEVSDCRSACIVTERDTRDLTIERTSIQGSTWDGISLNRTGRARIVGNTIRGNTAAGVTVEHLEDSLVADNTIADNGSHGVYLSDSYRNRFLRNRFMHNVNAGVFVTCAVRYRDPGPVLCWPDSMSRANTFEDNTFVGNRRAYIIAADAAANCTGRDVVPNLSRGDRFVDQPGIEQRAEAFGRCLHAGAERPFAPHPRPGTRPPQVR